MSFTINDKLAQQTYSNVTVVRDADGALSVWCDGTKLVGTKNVQIVNGDAGLTLVMGLPMSRVRMAEHEPVAQPTVLETKGNILQFPKFKNAYGRGGYGDKPPVSPVAPPASA